MAPPGSHQTRLGEQECATSQAYIAIGISQSMNQKVNLIVKKIISLTFLKRIIHYREQTIA